MFSPINNIFNLSKEYLSLNCDSSILKEKENTLAPFIVHLKKDEKNNYSFSDNEFSIKCIIKEEALIKFYTANSNENQIAELTSKN